MEFRQQENHKKNCVYYRLGKDQRLFRPQNYISGIQKDLLSTGEEGGRGGDKGERK